MKKAVTKKSRKKAKKEDHCQGYHARIEQLESDVKLLKSLAGLAKPLVSDVFARETTQ